MERVGNDSELERKIAQRLGQRLIGLRLSRGMTQEQVAYAAGLSRNHYQLLERGFSDRLEQRPANPRLSTLRGIAEVMGLPVSDLLAQLLADQPLASGGRLQAPPGSLGTGRATTRGTARGAKPGHESRGRDGAD